MIDFSVLNGRKLAMIAWAQKEDGSDDVAVFSGIAQWDGKVLTICREPATASFVVPEEWYSRLAPVEDDLKDMLLDAEYCFSVSVGDLDDVEDTGGFEKTGLKWPQGDDD